ncbi:hypothetical protein ACFSZS_20850 [Seohaeicola zhoushanensis]
MATLAGVVFAAVHRLKCHAGFQVGHRPGGIAAEARAFEQALGPFGQAGAGLAGAGGAAEGARHGAERAGRRLGQRRGGRCDGGEQAKDDSTGGTVLHGHNKPQVAGLGKPSGAA